MSHHFDSPTSREDGRVDLTDLFVFPSPEPGRTVLIMAVNPDAGLSSPTTFRPDARYVFNVDLNADLTEDFGLELRFGEPEVDSGTQTVTLTRTDQADLFLANGQTDQVIDVAGGGRLWAGLAGDPFVADAFALAQFQQAVFADKRFDPSVFGANPADFAGGRNVTAVVLDLPDDTFGGASTIAVWATTHILKDSEWIQINRAGKPMIHPLFTIVDEHLADAYNRTHPREDITHYSEPFAGVAASVHATAGGAAPAEHARRVVSQFLPDVLAYQLGTPAGYAAGNGRSLPDDVFSHAVGLLVNAPIEHGLQPRPFRPDFPYLAEPNQTQNLRPIIVHDEDGVAQFDFEVLAPQQHG